MSIPIRFKSLQIRNFLSFGNCITEINLSELSSILVQGENMDTGGANGCGKTTIINAITYALFNKPFDNISLQRLINSSNGSRNTLMEVRLFLDKGEDEFEIYRCRGESSNINVKLNGNDITLDSIAGNDSLIEEIIGMSFDLFTNVVIFSGNSLPFLQRPVAQQRAQIEELFNITILTEKAITLKEKIKQSNNDISVQEAIIKQQENAAALHAKQLSEAEARVKKWETDRQKNAELLLSQLERSDGVDIDKERECHETATLLKSAIASIVAELQLTQKDKSTLEKETKALDAELDHLKDSNCPYCKQNYAGSGDKLVEKTESFIAKTKLLNKSADLLTDQTNKKNALDAELALIKGQMKFASLEEALRIVQIAATAKHQIDMLVEQVNPHNDAFAALQNEASTNVDYAVLNELKREVEHQQFLLKLLTDKNSFIRRRIISKTIPFLNARLKTYTQEIGLPHLVKFDDDMSCTVAEYGRELDFGNLSSGEKKRVNLSLSLAFRDVLHHLHSRVNLLFIDEIDASLDSSGVEQIFKLLKQKTRDDGLGLWIISHRPEAVGRFDASLKVIKENGFSRIEYSSV